jgi:hypothetical protein
VRPEILISYVHCNSRYEIQECREVDTTINKNEKL